MKYEYLCTIYTQIIDNNNTEYSQSEKKGVTFFFLVIIRFL